jgi:UPF0755 protein
MNRSRLLGIGVMVAVTITLCGAAGFAVWALVMRPAGNGERVEVTIDSGMNAAGVARTLKKAGMIRNETYFRWIAVKKGYDTRFKAGVFHLEGTATPEEIARLLAETMPVMPDTSVTIIEGLTIAETAALLDGVAAIDSASFAKFAMDSGFARTLGIDKPTLEGYLYPDTYFIRRNTTARDMIERMTGTFRKVFDDSLRARASAMGMSVHEAVTLASIIELEAGHAEERPIISQVFHRRLELGWPLEANPTIQYILGEKRRIYTGDLEIKSPYNTYIHTGLPPGPIASPGRTALEAAVNPSKTAYLYFMADGVGGHVFSTSLEEHNRAVSEYRKIRRQRSVQ